MSLRLLRFFELVWLGRKSFKGRLWFVCFLSINTIQGDGGSHSQADQKCQPSDWKGRYPSDQAVHTQRWRGSHQREQTPAIARSEFFWLPRPQKKETRVTLFGLDPIENGQHIWQPCYNPFPLKSVVCPAWHFEKCFIYLFSKLFH